MEDPTRAVAPALDDRELLELAARAAGMALRWHEPDGGDPWCYVPSAMPPHNRRESDKTQGTIWDPLTDDSDALRLAVKLRILVDPDGETYAVATAAPKGRGEFVAHEKHRGDPYAATRRAIVRAAADIGRSLAPAVPASEV